MQVIRSDRRLEALAWTFFSTLVSLSLAADGLKVGLEAERVWLVGGWGYFGNTCLIDFQHCCVIVVLMEYNSLVVAGCWTKNGVAVAD